jgi:hypothetical protein
MTRRVSTKLSLRRLPDLPIWVLRSTADRPLNSVVIAGPEGLVLINTGMNAGQGKVISDQIASLTTMPVTTVVYPHHPSTSCQGTPAITDQASAECGKVVILAAGRRDHRQHPGVAPNLLIDRECILELSGVTMRLLPVGTDTVGGTNIYLPHHRVAMITDEPCMWTREIGPGRKPSGTAPFARAVNWFLRFPVEHLLGSHMLPLTGPEVHVVLRTHADRPSRRFDRPR